MNVIFFFFFMLVYSKMLCSVVTVFLVLNTVILDALIEFNICSSLHITYIRAVNNITV